MRERRGGKTRHDTGRGGREKGCNAGELARGKVNITILYTCEIFKKISVEDTMHIGSQVLIPIVCEKFLRYRDNRSSLYLK